MIPLKYFQDTHHINFFKIVLKTIQVQTFNSFLNTDQEIKAN